MNQIWTFARSALRPGTVSVPWVHSATMPEPELEAAERGDPAAARAAGRQGRRTRRCQGPARGDGRPLGPAHRPPPQGQSGSSRGCSRAGQGNASAARAERLGLPPLLDRHAGLRNAGRRPAGDARLGARASASATGSSASSTTAPTTRRCARSLERGRPRGRPHPGHPPRGERRHRRRLQRRAGDGGGEFVVLLDHDDELHPDALRWSTRRCAPIPRSTTSTPTKTRSTRRAPLGAVLQARLVAGAVPDPDVHLPPQRPAPLAGRGGRRLRRRVRGLPGLGPDPAGHRAGAEGRPRAAGPLPLADARDLGRRRRRRGEAVGVRSRDPGAAGALRADRAAGQGRARPRPPRRLRARPRARAASSGQHRHPDRR